MYKETRTQPIKAVSRLDLNFMHCKPLGLAVKAIHRVKNANSNAFKGRLQNDEVLQTDLTCTKLLVVNLPFPVRAASFHVT